MRRAAQLSVGVGFVLTLWSAIGWSAPDKFSLDELKRLALASNRSLTAALSGVDASRAGVLTASAYPNPETEFGFGHAAPRLAGGAAGASHTYTLTQRIDNPWQREARIAAAQSAVSSAESGLRVSPAQCSATPAIGREQRRVCAAGVAEHCAGALGDRVLRPFAASGRSGSCPRRPRSGSRSVTRCGCGSRLARHRAMS